MEARRQGWARVIAVVVLTLAVLYLMRLAGLMLTTRRAHQIEGGLAAEVGALHQEIQAIQTVSTTMGSDAYVEQWARDKQHLVKPGDHPVDPVAAQAASGGAGQAGANAQAEPGLWERFSRWLGGEH